MSATAKKVIILAGDFVLLYLVLFLTVYLRYNQLSPEHANFTTGQLFRLHVEVFTPLIFVWLIVFYTHSLYEITSAKNNLEFYRRLARSVAVNFFIAVLFFYFADFANVAPKTNLFIYFAIFSVCFAFWRSEANSLFKKHLLTKTLIISADDSGAKLAAKLNQNPQIGYKVEAVTDFQSKGVNTSEIINQKDIRVLIVDDKLMHRESLALSLNDFLDNIEVISLDKFNERIWRKVNLKNVNQLWFLSNFATGRKSVYDTVKRLADFSISLLFLPLAVPAGILIALMVKLCDKGTVFYRQVRVGHKGRYFTLVKFRTMREDAESSGVQWTVKNDQRVTKVGRFLRKIRLDELPQLWNIFKGEMSFVGPRAERPEFHDLLVKEIPFYDRRYLVKPGLTGWAQINYTYGSSVADTREKLAYDFFYLKNRSFIFDVGIILKTINIVLSGLGR